jgi:hypothetical protein
MWWNRGTRFPENFWKYQFGIAQKILKTKLLQRFIYLIATLYIQQLYSVTTKDNDRRVALLLRFS